MDFEHFASARDLFYLGSLLLGTSLGAFLTTRLTTCTLRQKSVWITAILFLLSFALASLAGAAILSGCLIFGYLSLYPFVILFLATGTLAVRFPRIGGYAIIITTTIFLIWISFSFLVFPRFTEPEQLTLRSATSGQILVRMGITARGLGNTGKQDAETWTIDDDGRPITFEAVSITAYPGYPLIGGEQRGIITQVTRRGERLFILAGSLYLFSRSRSPGFVLEHHTLDMPPGSIRPGINLSVLFDGKRLYFDPPIQL